MKTSRSLNGTFYAALTLLGTIGLIISLPGAVRAQDDAITVPAPLGLVPQVWVDMDPTGNNAGTVGSIERCKRITTLESFFVDVVGYNLTALGYVRFTLYFDANYVQVENVDVNFKLTATGRNLCVFNWSVTGNALAVDAWTEWPGAGDPGDGVIARIEFSALAPLGQSGFDLDYVDVGEVNSAFCVPAPCAACAIEFSTDGPDNYGVAQGWVDPTGTIGCWTVTSTGDSGDLASTDGVCDTNPALGIIDCTLRAAIEEANDYGGANRISFRLPDETQACGPPCVILPKTVLPALNDPTGGTEIDASTQPQIVIDGAVLAAGDGITMNTDGNKLKGATIQNFVAGNGVKISGDGNEVKGCNIGVNALGLFPAPNNTGINIGPAASFNQIGGPAAADLNVISGNTPGGGVVIAAAFGSCDGNVIEGNRIGTDLLGSSAIPNAGPGVTIAGLFGGNARNNVVGGSMAGSGNLISGNASDGVLIQVLAPGADVSGNRVEGNVIGLDVARSAPIANTGDGVDIIGAPDNVVGGFLVAVGPGSPPGNLISGNFGHGVHISASTATGNRVEGNKIGLNIVNDAVMNTLDGVHISNTHDNTVGGTVNEERNVISGNGNDGVEITMGATGNVVTGNRIGTHPLGGAAVPNGGAGVHINGASNNRVGDTTPTPGTPPGNLISGNGGHGVSIYDIEDDDGYNDVIGNIIGLNITGTGPLANALNGVLITDSPNNTIGGSTSSGRNIISANGGNGVRVSDSDGNVIQSNYIGTDLLGTVGWGNGSDGVHIDLGSTNTMVGGLSEGNVISDNTDDGVELTGVGSDDNGLLANIIGLAADGLALLGNGDNGVEITGGAQSNDIGSVGAGNVISDNTTDGISVTGAGTDTNLIRSNTIGLDQTGLVARGNGGDGVEISGGAQSNWVGGTTAGDGNLISANGEDGVEISGAGTDDNRVEDNTIGPDLPRSAPQPNGSDGVEVSGGAQATVVTGNVIEANTANGVNLDGANTDLNEVLANFIGSSTLPNGQNGVVIQNGAQMDQVTQNNIGNNLQSGILITGNDTDGHTITANMIIGNLGDGVQIDNGASGNFIGGFIEEATNEISGNAGSGVNVIAGTGNPILRNRISSNGGLGIDLMDDGVSGNDGGDGDGGPNGMQNFPTLSGATLNQGMTRVAATLNSQADRTYRVQVFANDTCDPSGFGEGETFLGDTLVTTDLLGNVAFTVSVNPTAIGDTLTATATDTSSNDTSEFSACVVVTAGGSATTDLAIDVSAPDSVEVGDTLVYTITVTNQGSNPASGVVAVDTLPDGMTFVSAGSSQGTCSGTAIVSCDVGTMVVLDVVTITITATADAEGDWVDAACVDANEVDPVPGNDCDAATTTVDAPINTGVGDGRVRGSRLEITVSPNPFNPTTTVGFYLPAAMPVTAEVWSVDGRRVRTLLDRTPFAAGSGQVRWDGRNSHGVQVASGVYFIRVRTPASTKVARALLLK